MAGMCDDLEHFFLHRWLSAARARAGLDGRRGVDDVSMLCRHLSKEGQCIMANCVEGLRGCVEEVPDARPSERVVA